VKKHHRALALIAVCAAIIALLSSLIWIGGFFREKEEVLPSIKTELDKNGIYAQLDVTPEVGILPGDILIIEWKIFFYPETIEVDKNKIAEQYINFKENYLVRCEEYSHVILREKTLKNIRIISVTVEFQCWFTEAREMTLETMFQYSQIKNGVLISTSTLRPRKNIAFASMSADNPRLLAEHTFPGHGLDIWLIVMGAIFIVCGTVFAVKTLVSLNKKHKTENRDVGSPDNDPLKTLTALKTIPLRSACDKLYHLCLKIEKENGRSNSLDSVKRKLQQAYRTDEVQQEDFEDCLNAVENILRNGGETLC